MGKELSLYIRVNRIGIFVNLPLSFDLGAPVQYRPSFSFDSERAFVGFQFPRMRSALKKCPASAGYFPDTIAFLISPAYFGL
jgi:hypothetical protein